jgi:hypothetical protein
MSDELRAAMKVALRLIKRKNLLTPVALRAKLMTIFETGL